MSTDNNPAAAPDCPEQKNIVLLSEITIGAPTTDGDVRRTGSVLVSVGGTFFYGPDYELIGIKVLTVKTDNGSGADNGNPYASDVLEIAAVTSSPDAIDIPEGNISRQYGTWSANLIVAANIDRDPDYTWNRISVYADVLLVNTEGTALTPGEVVAGNQFKATPVDSLIRPAPATPSPAPQHGDHCRKEAIHVPAMLQPLEVCDGWIRYSFFSLSGGSIPMPPINGYLLASPDCCETALSARSIAIATGAIDWHPRQGRNLVITRSHGILDTGPFDGSTRRRMQFDGLPKFCFLVHQLRNSAAEDVTRIPVDAECRERPQRILLNPQKPFYVQVNNVQDDRTKSDGTLDFWVKILS